MLTDVVIRQAKAGNKTYKLQDGEGLYLLISSKSKRWYLRYSFAGKRIDKPLGKYPAVSLLEARKIAIETQITIANGQIPFYVAKKTITFADAFEKLFAIDSTRLAETTMNDRRERYRKYVELKIGHIALNEITPHDVLAIVLPIHDSGREALSKKVRILIGQIFREGIKRHGLTYDPSQAAQGLPRYRKTRHHPHIDDPAVLGRLIVDIEKGARTNCRSVQMAMRLLPYVFVRPHELRFAHGRDFYLDEKIWRRPAMGKMGRPHIIPLATQVITMLREWFNLTGCYNKYLFPSPISKCGVLSDGTMNRYLKKLGYSGHVITPHGFRGTASTYLYEHDYKEAWIERQLDHREEKEVKASYDHSKYLKQRTKMMQDYADYLDSLKIKFWD